MMYRKTIRNYHQVFTYLPTDASWTEDQTNNSELLIYSSGAMQEAYIITLHVIDYLQITIQAKNSRQEEVASHESTNLLRDEEVHSQILTYCFIHKTNDRNHGEHYQKRTPDSFPTGQHKILTEDLCIEEDWIELA